MSRPLRIEFDGAVYHVTSRGDRREAIFDDDEDRQAFLAVVARGVQRFDAQVLAYCLMGNHYHLVLHTRRAQLSMLMRQINGVYTQAFNRRHGKVGHVFQGRFKAILVDRNAYLLELCRYVELNPVRAGMVDEAGAWPWSSYGAHIGLTVTPAWLDTEGLHGYLLGRPAVTAADRRKAAQRYAQLVRSAPNLRLWDTGLRQQIFLGDEAFVERMQALMREPELKDRNIPKAHRQAPMSVAQWLDKAESREAGIWQAYAQGGLSMTQIARVLDLSVSRVSRLIKAYEEAKGKT